MIIYLASRYSRAPQLREIRSQLLEMGHKVTSRWLDGSNEIGPDGSAQADDEKRMRFALEDWADMKCADCVISFTEEPRKTSTRGGRHVEFGAALAMGKRCIIIGYRENVFHHMPQVEFYSNWDCAKTVLHLNIPEECFHNGNNETAKVLGYADGKKRTENLTSEQWGEIKETVVNKCRFITYIFS